MHRPLLAWADHFKIETVESDNPPTSWFYDLAHNARIVRWFENKIAAPLLEWFDRTIIRRSPMGDVIGQRDEKPGAGLLPDDRYRGRASCLWRIPCRYNPVPAPVKRVDLHPERGVRHHAARFRRSRYRHVISIPLGYAIGSNPKVASWLQPVVQVVASLPATALFPLLVAVLAGYYGGLNLCCHHADVDGNDVVSDV